MAICLAMRFHDNGSGKRVAIAAAAGKAESKRTIRGHLRAAEHRIAPGRLSAPGHSDDVNPKDIVVGNRVGPQGLPGFRRLTRG